MKYLYVKWCVNHDVVTPLIWAINRFLKSRATLWMTYCLLSQLTNCREYRHWEENKIMKRSMMDLWRIGSLKGRSRSSLGILNFAFDLNSSFTRKLSIIKIKLSIAESLLNRCYRLIRIDIHTYTFILKKESTIKKIYFCPIRTPIKLKRCTTLARS
jgi:hypothetical protein